MRNPSLVARKTPHLLLAKTPAFSSPLGEGEEARPFEEIDTDARPLGYAKVSGEGKSGGIQLSWSLASWVRESLLIRWEGVSGEE